MIHESICWIPVTSATPNHPIEVIVYDADVGEVTTGYFDGKWHAYEGDESGYPVRITFWAFMPIGPLNLRDRYCQGSD